MYDVEMPGVHQRTQPGGELRAGPTLHQCRHELMHRNIGGGELARQRAADRARQRHGVPTAAQRHRQVHHVPLGTARTQRVNHLEHVQHRWEVPSSARMNRGREGTRSP
jgi:hypothetical protein